MTAGPVLVRSQTSDGMNVGWRIHKANWSSSVVDTYIVDRCSWQLLRCWAAIERLAATATDSCRWRRHGYKHQPQCQHVCELDWWKYSLANYFSSTSNWCTHQWSCRTQALLTLASDWTTAQCCQRWWRAVAVVHRYVPVLHRPRLSQSPRG